MTAINTTAAERAKALFRLEADIRKAEGEISHAATILFLVHDETKLSAEIRAGLAEIEAVRMKLLKIAATEAGLMPKGELIP